MKKAFINEILRNYEKKRDYTKTKRLQRLQEVYSRVPEIKKIDREVQKLGISISKSLIHGETHPEKMIDTLKSQLLKLKQDKAMLLTENNIPLQYLDEEYDCSQCKDTGFLNTGKKCNCFKQEIINYSYKMSNLSTVLQKENFNHFNMALFSEASFEEQAQSPRENMLHILNVSEGFVFNFDKDNEENLLFYGSTGLGKTFLANCVAKSLLDKGHIVIYQTAFKLLEIISDLRFQNKQEKNKYDLLFEADLLIIDDLGTEMTNTFTNSELFNIINSRLLSNKKTLISTNLSPKELMDRYDDRIFSRLFSKFTVLKFYGNDLRWESQ
ncbi:Chromosomal replication initiator, DnaA [Alkaliphilus metalliredigens QYMF]|uniref:Chromosomal replication initiator, DnaA n=1 Tax=Alkaliphilus metalliredigens (strain QYMF) TaxID=293826 RepID=A6TXB2_ALKMQ|nr:ATP-binding protein [Alkaliphilus metalliredigens]ABR50830.1 Chromosomal replication initiator, DnaA [Alkaliphilus metalliredigens QYMF]